jgi:hypothetical protein
MATMAPTAIEEISARCVAECLRQGVGIDGVGRLLVAYDRALDLSTESPTETAICELARIIEPGAAEEYRRVPVTFRGGGHSTDWREVPDAMRRLFGTIHRQSPPEEVVRAFLHIHPFTDGNGRVAFVLYNWLRGTLSSPAPLPELDW